MASTNPATSTADDGGNKNNKNNKNDSWDWDEFEQDMIDLAIDVALRIVWAIGIYIVGMILIFILRKIVTKILSKRSTPPKVALFVVRVIVAFLKILLWFIILGVLGLEVGGLATVLAAFVFAIGFAMSNLVLHVIAGLILLTTERIRPGDVISVNGTTATVTAIEIFDTELTSFDNQKIVIPNGDVLQSEVHIINFHKLRRVDFAFGIGYQDDIKRAKAIIAHNFRQDPHTLKDDEEHEPTIAVTEHGDSCIVITSRVWCKTQHYWDVYFNLMERIKYQFDEHGISIPYPQRDVHIMKEETPVSAGTEEDLEMSDTDYDSDSESSESSDHKSHKKKLRKVKRGMTPKSKKKKDEGKSRDKSKGSEKKKNDD